MGSPVKSLFRTLPTPELSSFFRLPCQSSKTKRPPGKHGREWNVPGFSKGSVGPRWREQQSLSKLSTVSSDCNHSSPSWESLHPRSSRCMALSHNSCREPLGATCHHAPDSRPWAEVTLWSLWVRYPGSASQGSYRVRNQSA